MLYLYTQLPGTAFDILSTSSGRTYHFNTASGEEGSKAEWAEALLDITAKHNI